MIHLTGDHHIAAMAPDIKKPQPAYDPDKLHRAFPKGRYLKMRALFGEVLTTRLDEYFDSAQVAHFRSAARA